MDKTKLYIAESLRTSWHLQSVFCKYTDKRVSIKTDGKKTCISMDKYDNINITCNIDDIVAYANMHFITVNEASNKFMSHECFHLFLGHFSKKYKDHNKKILNFAGDLEINQILDLKDPLLTPENFGVPKGLKTDEYYSILIDRADDILKKFEEMVKSDESGIDLASALSDMSDSDITILGSFIEDAELDFNGEGEGIGNEGEGFGKNCRSLAKSLKDIVFTDRKLIDVTGVEQMFSEISSNETTLSLSKIGLVNDWSIYNKRKGDDKSGLLFPGNKIVKLGNKLKMHKNSTVFVDNSGSVRHIMPQIAWVLEELRKRYAINFVFYDTGIRFVCKHNEPLFIPKESCGTSINGAINDYQEMVRRREMPTLSQIYVITDGLDDFKDVLKDYVAKIFILDEEHIEKKFWS